MKDKRKSIISLIIMCVICISLLCVYFLMPSTKADPDSNTFTPDIYTSAQDTGAASAPKKQKGGALYIERGSVYTMKGGAIRAVDNVYGGAVYVANNATFNMEGGTIEGCSSKYGGAIYVEKGGTVNITNGSIINCSSEYAPAIYCEYGATINITNGFLDKNIIKAYLHISISLDTITVGQYPYGKEFRYIEFGSYPTTYVGSSMNTTLNNWLNTNSPEAVQTYTTKLKDSSKNTITYTAYRYTDGNLYACGTSSPYANNYTYSNGETVVAKNSTTKVWFKVEPIKWIVLNYDKYISGTDTYLEVMSADALSAGVGFYPSQTDPDGEVGTDDDPNLWVTSTLRQWVNNDFYNSAFSNTEKTMIVPTEIKNNMTNRCSLGSSSDESSGPTTTDKVYCPSYWEVYNRYLTGTNHRPCVPTDYTISTAVYLTTQTYDNQKLTYCDWWTRTAGNDVNKIIHMNRSGGLSHHVTTSSARGVRPVMRIQL